MRNAIYIGAALLLAFASADATGRRESNKIQIVIRGSENGPWKAYLFGESCHGTLRVTQPVTSGSDEPIVIECQ